MNFVEEIKWRGMYNDSMPGTDEQLQKEMTSAYIGFDPTATSLHIGSLAQIMTLRLFQKAGHKPVALIGGATGMIGDPSGKNEERNLLNEETLAKNLEGIGKQLRKLLDFDGDTPNRAEMVNNYDWMKNFSFLEFIRDIGKHLTVNYMMSKESVKKRLGKIDDGQEATGMSFTEFSYQLVQGYDFLWLYENKNCLLQMGGSDQWGNITTGTELIRRKSNGKAFALTTNLITKADGSKFGKTEKGNVWLDPELTSPYEFYQFWLNTADADAEKYIKIFTELGRTQIEAIITEHRQSPELRLLQKTLAKEVTILVHSEPDYNLAVEATQILFGKGTRETLQKLDEKTFLSIFDGLKPMVVNADLFRNGVTILDLLTEHAPVFASKGELRRLLKDNGLSINQTKEQNGDKVLNESDLLNDKYLLGRKGKKTYFLIMTDK